MTAQPLRSARADRALRPATARPQTGHRTGASILWEVLLEEGVEVVFGYPGGAIMPVYDAMADVPVRHVLARHEQGAAHMADGYARASGRTGVALATSGPGATNLVTGIATAMHDSVPLVCITGQVPSHLLGTTAFQEVDITAVVAPITKGAFLVTEASAIAPTLRRAFRLARSGRPGPVLVDITKDAQQASTLLLPPMPPPTRRSPAPDERLLDEAAELLDTATKPVILAGHGVIMSGATEALLALVDEVRAPVACTLLGLGGFPASHPLYLGMMGMHGEASVNRAISEADLLLAVGMRFDDRVTGEPRRFAPRARKIHVELDRREIGKIIPVDVPLVGDAREVLEALTPRLSPRSFHPWLSRIAQGQADTERRDIRHAAGRGELHAPHVIEDLWRLTKGRAVVVTDVGQHQMWEAQYYRHERPRSLITSGGLGTMGFALPAAIGAKMARPEEEVWVIVGDGGFQMTAAELTTCAQEGIKINVAIINNGYLGMVRQWQEMFYDGRYVGTPIQSPDFAQLARAHGLEGLRCSRREDLDAVVDHARQHPGTVVIDFRVASEENVYPMVSPGAGLEEMVRRPLTLVPGGSADP